jgi:RNA polymerase sigma factor (sigma-70 family)
MKPPVEAQALRPGIVPDPVVRRRPSRPARRLRAAPAPALRLLSDARLASLAQGGDRAAFGAIFDRYHQELFRYCISVLRHPEDAADALQSTMVRALNALEGETRTIAPRPWLYRIAFNESMTLLRRRPKGQLASDLPLPVHLDVEDDVALRAQLEQLVEDLRQLPERQRGALAMRELAGLGYSEIALALETSPAGAKQAIYDARRTLFELAKGREMDCDVVQSVMTHGDGRALRGRAFRAHLRDCGECSDFRATIADRQSKLAALTPGLPAAEAARLLERIASGGGGFAGGGLSTGLGVSIAVKSLSALAVGVTIGVGALDAIEKSDGAARAPVGAQPASVAAPAARATHARAHPGRAHRRGNHASGAAARGGTAVKRHGGAPAVDGPAPEVPKRGETVRLQTRAPGTPPAATSGRTAAPAPTTTSRPVPRPRPLRHFVRPPHKRPAPVRRVVRTIRRTTHPVVTGAEGALPVEPPVSLQPRRHMPPPAAAD